MTQPKNIAIIPARGGSKRLPGKNSRYLGDHPLMAHSILYAQRFPELIDTIAVTTDNDELASIARSYGAIVVMRPKELAGDQEPVITAMQHVLKTLQETFANVILLQPTNPLRPLNLLPEAYKAFSESNLQSLMSVNRFEEKFGTIENNVFTPSNYTMGQRSQDLEPMYRENGLLYITESKAIVDGTILTEDNFAYVTNTPFDHVDIDTELDFLIAETVLKKYSELL